jgi:hypothetical protein
MAANVSDTNQESLAEQVQTGRPPVPKRITNAQTVCSERNEKGKLCNGHLKQLRTAGEPAEVHLRGDDVLFKCQRCGTLYMGPPLGHVRDPDKQTRFVEAELTALLQAAGGTLPVVKKDERGVYVLVEGKEHGHAAAKPAPAAAAPATVPGAHETAPVPAAAATPPAPAAKAVAQPTAAKPTPRAGAEPDRQLMKRSTYCGVVDTGPAPGETFEQKVSRLRALSAAAKQRAEEGGAPSPAAAAAPTPAAEPAATATPLTTASAPTEAVQTPAAATQAGPPPSSGQADRTLFRRSTYCGVVDTGPISGETFEKKVERLRALAAAAKQRAEEGGAG